MADQDDTTNTTDKVRSILRHPFFLLLGVVAVFISLREFVIEPFRERDKFDDTAEIMIARNGSEFRSSTNYLISILPNGVISTREYQYWKDFTAAWRMHISRMEAFYSPLSQGMIEKTMRPGHMAIEICGNVSAILDQHFSAIFRIEQIRGVGVSYTGEQALELAMFGPVVVVPSIANLRIIYEKACGGDIKQLRLELHKEITERTIDEVIEDIAAEIQRLEQLKNYDLKSALKDAEERFITTLIQYQISLGMVPVEAKVQAYADLDEVHQSGNKNWLVPGLNDIVDQIQAIKNDMQRDNESELGRLRGLLESLVAERDRDRGQQ